MDDWEELKTMVRELIEIAIKAEHTKLLLESIDYDETNPEFAKAQVMSDEVDTKLHALMDKYPEHREDIARMIVETVIF